MPDIIYKAPHGSEDRHSQQYIYDNAKQKVVKYREYTSVENDNPDSPHIDYDDFLEEEHEYTYDILNHLTCEICGDTRTDFSYNSSGNILSKVVSKKDTETDDFIVYKRYDFVYNTSEQTRYYDPEIGRYIASNTAFKPKLNNQYKF